MRRIRDAKSTKSTAYNVLIPIRAIAADIEARVRDLSDERACFRAILEAGYSATLISDAWLFRQLVAPAMAHARRIRARELAGLVAGLVLCAGAGWGWATALIA